MRVEHPIPALWDAGSRILILGSFPSVKSRETAFFYGHPQNRFWRVCAAAVGTPVPASIAEKKAFLHENHIALWDVIASCEIVGSSDASIKNAVANDIRPILCGADIAEIYVNGKTAAALYEKYILPVTGRKAITLPSTSPANAAWSLARLTDAWSDIQKHLYGKGIPMKTNLANDLLAFIRRSPSCYHATDNFRTMLTENGYTELFEAQKWELKSGGKYFVCRNDSSLLAFRVPNASPSAFVMAAAHSDAPTFKIKEHAELYGSYSVRLNTEKYGGILLAPWFDRPLSVAGRVVVKDGGTLKTRLVDIDRDLLIIPSVAIHMNRTANDGIKYAANVDTLPLYGGEDAKESFLPMIAEAAGVKQEDILGTDLFLYCREDGALLGANNEFIASPKLDDLECSYACMQGFLAAKPSDAIPVCCIFDNEEVGSETKQGAASTFLRDILRRITLALGIGEEACQQMLAKSFLVSADNAHAMHPNHPEYADAANCPHMNGGVVIKYNANQRYATDAVSAALFKSVCEKAGVRVQTFANRSDLPGGSTLGSIASTLVPVKTVDIGLAQLAMHSVYETAGAHDVDDLCKAMTFLFAESEFSVN